MSAHVFDQALALTALPDGTWQGHTSPAYANMVGPFGGITAAQVLTAVQRHPQLLGTPLSLTVNYAAALADGAFVVDARPVRTNRSTQHWSIELRQNEQVVLTATAVTAARRDTWSLDDHVLPAVPQPADVPQWVRKLPLAWANNYEFRPISGLPPTVWDGSGSDSLTRQWVRDFPLRPLDFAALACLADVFYPRVWRRRATHVPASTVSMTVYFHAGPELLAKTGTGYLLAQAQAQAFRNGFFDQSAQLWNEAGDLLVTTHQIVYFKE
jgi:acyl-CoA thioesterase